MRKEKGIIEQLNDISEDEQLNEAIERIPVVGILDESKKRVILPISEKSDDDDFWDDLYRSTVDNGKL